MDSGVGPDETIGKGYNGNVDRLLKYIVGKILEGAMDGDVQR